jgi:hypothetical protein
MTTCLRTPDHSFPMDLHVSTDTICTEIRLEKGIKSMLNFKDCMPACQKLSMEGIECVISRTEMIKIVYS